MLFLCYPKCSTCIKALKWLNDNNITVEVRDIKINNPTVSEIKLWHDLSGEDIKKFFNTSGLIYKELNLKDKLPSMKEEEKYEMLSTNGMLVKRPLLILKDKVLIGFNQDKWEKELL